MQTFTGLVSASPHYFHIDKLIGLSILFCTALKNSVNLGIIFDEINTMTQRNKLKGTVNEEQDCFCCYRYILLQDLLSLYL